MSHSSGLAEPGLAVIPTHMGGDGHLERRQANPREIASVGIGPRQIHRIGRAARRRHGALVQHDRPVHRAEMGDAGNLRKTDRRRLDQRAVGATRITARWRRRITCNPAFHCGEQRPQRRAGIERVRGKHAGARHLGLRVRGRRMLQVREQEQADIVRYLQRIALRVGRDQRRAPLVELELGIGLDDLRTVAGGEAARHQAVGASAHCVGGHRIAERKVGAGKQRVGMLVGGAARLREAEIGEGPLAAREVRHRPSNTVRPASSALKP